MVTACLASTRSIRVGPNATNPVSRHWTTHAAAARTLEELFPGRSYLAIAAGDGAVHSVGLRPAKAAELEAAVTSIVAAAPPGIDLQVALGGPRMAETAGRVAKSVVFGTGTDPVAIRSLAARVGDGRRQAGSDEPFEVWALVLLNIVEHEDEVAAARAAFAPIAIAGGFSLQ